MFVGEIIKEVVYVSALKLDENTTNILKLLFFKINLHFVTSDQVSAYRNFGSHKQYLFHLLISRNAKETQAD